MTTTRSEARPVKTVKRLNWISTRNPTKACASMNMVACATVTCFDGIGRERVRSTSPSRSRSTRSFQVQPAPRIAKAPMKKRTMCHALGKWPSRMPASPTDHQHGTSRSHEPIGRSSRARRRYGRLNGGARPSTQFPVASATRPEPSLICFRAGCRSGCHTCRVRF